MEIKFPGKKFVIILSAVCCVLMLGVGLFQRSRVSMDVIIFMGQSNMSGAGDASEAPELTEGAGYEFRSVTDPTRLYTLEEPFGENENRGALDDTQIMERTGSLVTAFVNACYARTGTPVVGISASRGSSSLNGWLSGGLKEEAAARLNSAYSYLESDRIRVRHTFMVWFQGEADVNLATTDEEYREGMTQLVSYMKEVGVEACFLIEIGPDLNDPERNLGIMESQLKLCEENDDIVLISSLPEELTDRKYKDEGGIHFTQAGLNLIGFDAGDSAGEYISSLR